MANSLGATYMYTETRLNLDQAYAGSTIELLPNGNRSIVNTTSNITDEAAFSRELTNDASIFFRRESRYPRSFLWRLLDDRHVLEIQSVDLTQDPGEQAEALLTLRLRFSSPIRPYCVAFADPEEKDALVVSAITTTGELYTFTLHKDAFVHLKATEALPTDWCRIFTPPALRIREPFKLTAIHSDQLFVSLSDGGLLKLEQSSSNHSWRESYFAASGWNIPRALAKWKGDNFAKFGETELNPSTAVSIAISPDNENLITVCLNHTLRIWNASSGRIVMQSDLIESDEQKIQQHSKFLISPTQRQLLQVLDVTGRDGDLYYVVTFSPKNNEFTFWNVLDAGSGDEGIRRLEVATPLIPPIDELMETSAWILEEFFINANRNWSKTQLWLRARSGPISRVFTVSFNLFDDDDLSTAWTSGWAAASSGRQSTEYLALEVPPEVQAGDSRIHCPAITPKWLDFLFYPGRFTISTLETALHVYSKGVTGASHKIANVQKIPLKERISSAVSRKAAFALIGGDFDHKEMKISEEWHMFYGLVQDLHKRRTSAISFSYDVTDRLPWIICADFVSPVRRCTDLDICDFHRSPERASRGDEQVAKLLTTSYETIDLLNAAHAFRTSLSPIFIDNFKSALIPELLSDPTSSISDRMLAFHEQADFSTYIGEEDWDRLYDILEEHGGYDVLDFESFTSVLEQLSQDGSGRRNHEQITRYGSRALIRTAQENLSLHTHTLLDLLLLVVYVETEVDPSDLESGMQNPWKGRDLYVAILSKLKEQAVLDFMMRNVRTEKSKRHRRVSIGDTPTASRTSISESSQAPSYTSTLLESLFIGDWASIHIPANMELPDLISYWAQRWTSALDLSTQFDSFTAHVLADLIKHKNEAQASSFASFVPITGWSMYLKGRLHLSLGENSMAAMHFKKAAYSISLMDVTQFDTADILRPDERNDFSRGIVGYYEHVMNLFDQINASSYVVDFAQAALQHQELEPLPTQGKKGSHKSAAVPSSPVNLLSRLFTAALDSSQYDVAYSALVRLPPALRKSSLQQFVDSLVRARQSKTLLSYPFATLTADLDAELERKSRRALSVATSRGPEYHKVLYALRIKRGDYRGAAQCLFEYVCRLRAMRDVVLDPRLAEGYMMLINAMACCGEDDAWVLEETKAADPTDGKRRKVVFLEEVRHEYQRLLDEVQRLHEGRYAFAGGEEMEVDDL